MGVIEDLRALRGEIQQTATVASASAKSVTESVRQIDDAAKKTRTARDLLQEVTDQVRDKAHRAIGDLEAYAAKAGGPFAAELKLQLNAIEIGGQSLEKFMALMGDSQVVTENGVQTIRQLLEGIDFKAFTNEVDQLARDIDKGSKTLADGLNLLKERGGQLTAEFLKTVEAFQRGNATVDRLLGSIDQAKKLLKDPALGNLLDELAKGLIDQSRQNGRR